jgi:hypothetical protein
MGIYGNFIQITILLVNCVKSLKRVPQTTAQAAAKSIRPAIYEIPVLTMTAYLAAS